jgi:DNA-binding winged helix-turn-helix (wHTH) protein
MDAACEPRLAVNGMVADFEAGILRDSAGDPVALRPQAFEVLRHLVANPGRLVTKDELMAAVWPGVAVTDDSLVQCIHDIRRALGDEARTVLRTVPRRGYRLVPPGDDRRDPSSSLRRWPVATAAAVALALAAAGA